MIKVKTFTSVIAVLFLVMIFTTGCLFKIPGHRLLEDDSWVLRFDASGNEVWKTYIDGDNKDTQVIVETDNGGIVVAGSLRNLSTGISSPWMTKLDKNGKIEWDRIYKFIDNDRVTSVVQTNGYFIAVSYSGTLFKTDSNGNLLWEKHHIGDSGWWRISTLTDNLVATSEEKIVWFDENGNFLDQIIHSPKSDTPTLQVAGVNNSTIIAYGSTLKSNREIYVKNISMSGNITWSTVVSKDEINWPIALFEPSQGHYDIVYSNNSGADYAINRMEISADGNIISTQRIDAHTPLASTSDNGFIYAGFGDSGGDEDKRTGIFGKLPPLTLVKIDNDSNKQWVARSDPGDYWYLWYFFYPEPVNRKVMSVIQTKDGGYAVLVKTYKI